MADALPPDSAAPTTPASAFPWEAVAVTPLDADATERLIAALSDETFQLIIREAYLYRAGQIIMKAREDAKAKEEQVSSTRPPFLLLRRTETKHAFHASLVAAKEDSSLYENAARRNADAMKTLRGVAGAQLEACLRETDPTYYAGLVSKSLVADWQGCVARIEANVTEFIAAIGAARNAMVGARRDETGVCVVSDVSRQAILRAAELGGLLSGELASTTALADERDAQLRGTLFADEFPRLTTVDFGGALEDALNLPVAVLQAQFTLILGSCAELRSQGLPTALQKVKQAEARYNALQAGYLAGVWQALREYALQHYVQDEDLHEVAATTEAMCEAPVPA